MRHHKEHHNTSKCSDIGYRAFDECPNLEKVVIKEGQLKEIGNEAFSECESLKSVELPDNVKVIGNSAFYICKNLESVTMNGVETIGSYAFDNCKKLASVEMNSVESIGKRAFFYCALTSVHLPNTLKSIGEDAFSYCNLESITIPDSVSVENIDGGVFSNCKKLKKAVLPDDWNEIKEGMFADCESLEDVNLPSVLKIIGEVAFRGCSSLKEVIIPDGVTEIRELAFYSCYGLSKVTIPDSVKIIGDRAFRHSPLSEIIIPDDATVEGCAFSLSTNLRTISLPASVINAGVKFWDIIQNDDNYSNKCPELEIPKFNDISHILDCRNIDIILRDGATRITKEFFGDIYHSNIMCKSIKIPYGVKIVEENALLCANFVNDVELPDSVTVVENYGCYGVPVKRIPSNIECIGYRAFTGYSGENATIPRSVKFFDESAFYGSDVKSVIIEPGITEIPGIAFAGYSSDSPGVLEKIEIPNTVTKIGASAFFYQPNLTDVKIPDSVKCIEFGAFKGCKNLNTHVTGKWYRVNIYNEADVVDPADPNGKNLYLYSNWNWYRK